MTTQPREGSPGSPEPQITRWQRWLSDTRGLAFPTYEALWRWSVDEPEAFWGALWEWFDIQSATPHECVLRHAAMPGAEWFPGAQVNFARQALRHAAQAEAAQRPALVWQDERMAAPAELGWPELEQRVAAFAHGLRALGVQTGDRVCAVLPNAPEAVVAFLACASLGAIWSLASPDMGPVALADRFRQIEPKVLIAVDGQFHGGRAHDRRPVLHTLLAELPSVRRVVLHRALAPDAPLAAFDAPGRITHAFAELLQADPTGFEPLWLPFDHPLWIVYSSGTTGLPKAIVHGHGGIVLELMKMAVLHNDLHAAADPAVAGGERFFWFTSTGWVMWNALVGALLGGTTVCLYDGHPATPDGTRLWRFAADARVTFFGAGAAFFASCMKEGVQPQASADLSRLRAIGSTGSPLSEEAYDWIWAQMPKTRGTPDGAAEGARIWIAPISGGTDFAGAFVGGLRTLPVVRGEMQVRCLGAAVEAWSEPDEHGRGRPLIDEVGELVCTRPLPSMPLYLWGDASGERYRESYFDLYPGVWRHGDWIRLVPHGPPDAPTHHGAVIYGRSDATINRHGIRMGTAELYRAVEALPEVLDSLVVDLEHLGQPSWMGLFVVLRDGVVLDEALEARLRAVIRAALSPRHVPDALHRVAAIPRTLSGKKMELPVKKLLQGASPDAVFKRDAMANGESVDWFVALAAARRGGDE